MIHDPDGAINDLVRSMAAAEEENRDLRARLAAVESLHSAVRGLCRECGGWEESERWPCPTVAAARGEGDPPVEPEGKASGDAGRPRPEDSVLSEAARSTGANVRTDLRPIERP